MYQGQVLCLPEGTNGLTLWSPWMSKGGDRAAMTYEIVAALGFYDSFGVEVWTKAADDRAAEGVRIAETTDFVSSVGAFYSALNIEGFDQLYRFKILFSATDNTGATTLIYRFLEPTWYNLAGAQS